MPDLILGIHVGTILEEQLQRFNVASLRGPDERRLLALSLLVSRLNVNSGLVQEIPDDLGLVVLSGLHQRGLLPTVFDLYQGCQMAKFYPFLSLDCAGVEGLGAPGGGRGGTIQGKEGIKFCCIA